MLYLSLFLAGFIYIVTPGPVFLAIISLVSERGRLEGIKLVSGAIFGCMVWLSLTCLFLIEADKIPKAFFIVLSFACSLYLFFLAYKMVTHGRENGKSSIFEKPFREGLVIGFLNPKSYPVMVSVFSALVFEHIANIGWSDFFLIFLFGVLGFASGYTFMVFTAGFNIITNFYKNHIVSMSYAFGAIFTYFGSILLIEGVKLL